MDAEANGTCNAANIELKVEDAGAQEQTTAASSGKDTGENKSVKVGAVNVKGSRFAAERTRQPTTWHLHIR